MWQTWELRDGDKQACSKALVPSSLMESACCETYWINLGFFHLRIISSHFLLRPLSLPDEAMLPEVRNM